MTSIPALVVSTGEGTEDEDGEGMAGIEEGRAPCSRGERALEDPKPSRWLPREELVVGELVIGAPRWENEVPNGTSGRMSSPIDGRGGP